MKATNEGKLSIASSIDHFCQVCMNRLLIEKYGDHQKYDVNHKFQKRELFMTSVSEETT